MNLLSIFKNYKEPTTLIKGGGSDYCVLGIFCHYVVKECDDIRCHPCHDNRCLHFPSHECGARILMSVNKELTRLVAEDFAFKIIVANDSTDFEKAKQILADALGYKKPIEPVSPIKDIPAKKQKIKRKAGSSYIAPAKAEITIQPVEIPKKETSIWDELADL